MAKDRERWCYKDARITALRLEWESLFVKQYPPQLPEVIRLGNELNKALEECFERISELEMELEALTDY